jgi:hypothetical protein
MIERFYSNYTPVCDCCEKRLPGELSFQAAVRAIRAAGWDRRKVDCEWEDICTDCLFEEKGYGDDN